MAAAVLIFGGLGAAVYLGILPGLRDAASTEDHARFYPDDVIAFAWIDRSLPDGQRDEEADALARLIGIPAFEFVWDESNGSGLDLEEDLLAWTGEEFSAALLGIDPSTGSPDAVVMVEVVDREAAAEFLREELGFERRGTSGGFQLYLETFGPSAYAISDDLLVIATTRDSLEAVLERAAGGPGPALADHADFKEARAALTGGRFASAYVSLEGASELLAELGLGSPLELLPMLTGALGSGADVAGGSCEYLSSGTPRWIAGSAAWVDRGVTFEAVSPDVSGAWPRGGGAPDAAEVLPDDTAAFVSVSFDPDLDHWREALSECRAADLVPGLDQFAFSGGDLADLMGGLGLGGLGFEGITISKDLPALGGDSTLAEVLDAAIDLVAGTLGTHLEEDLLDHLEGGMIAAVMDFDFAEVSEVFEGGRIDAMVALSHRSGDGPVLQAAIDGLFESAGSLLSALSGEPGLLDLDHVDVGATNDARLLYNENLADVGYSPGYVLHAGYLTFGSTEQALRSVVAGQAGEGAKLASDAEYLRAVSHLPEERDFLAYLDLGNAKLGEPAEVIGAIALSGRTGEKYSRVWAALTFRAEE